jgi:hypothetical protein
MLLELRVPMNMHNASDFLGFLKWF